MLKIKDEQLDAMTGVVVQDLHARLFRFARRDMAPFIEGLSDEALRERIREDHEAAQRFGIRSFRGVTQFVGLSLIGGPTRFYEERDVIELLSVPGADPEVSLEVLLQGVKNLAAQGAE